MSRQAFSQQMSGAVTVGKSQALTVTMAPLCSGVPVSRYSVTVTQQTQNRDPGTGAATRNSLVLLLILPEIFLL